MSFFRVVFMSRNSVEAITDLKYAPSRLLISITSPQGTPYSRTAKVNKECFRDILFLEFHDADPKKKTVKDKRLNDPDIKRVYFDKKMAAEIFKFLRKHELSSLENCSELDVVVNCEAGISRSAGVAKFINDLYRLDSFPERYQNYNKHVYSTLVNAYATCVYENSPLHANEIPQAAITNIDPKELS